MKRYYWLSFRFIRGNWNPCDEFTLGKCDIPPEYFDQWTITENSGKCQEFCIENACVTFQYTSDTKNCTLMKEDYRQVCKTVGLPNVSFLLIDNKKLICHVIKLLTWWNSNTKIILLFRILFTAIVLLTMARTVIVSSKKSVNIKEKLFIVPKLAQ